MKRFLSVLIICLLIGMFLETSASAYSDTSAFYGPQGYYLNDEFTQFDRVTVYRNAYHDYLFYEVGKNVKETPNPYKTGPLKITDGINYSAVINYNDGYGNQQIELPYVYGVSTTTNASKVQKWRYGTSVDNINTPFRDDRFSDADNYLLGTEMPIFPTTVINDQYPIYVAYIGHRFYTVTFEIPEGITEETSITLVTTEGEAVLPPELPETHEWDSDGYLSVNEKLIIHAVSRCTEHQIVMDAEVEPTCTETGLTAGSHCEVCHEILEKQETIPALGHTPVIDAAVEPDGTHTGLTEGSHCSVCGEVLIPQRIINESGFCGENAKWKLDSNGIMTISGSGTIEAETPFGFPDSVRADTVRVEIGEGITAVRKQTFADFANLQEIYFPASFTMIIDDTDQEAGLESIDTVFSNCNRLTAFEVAESNSVLSSANGILYLKEQNTLLRCPVAFSGAVVPADGIKTIENNAFKGCSEVTSITLTHDVSFIPDNAFSDCNNNLTLYISEGSYAQEYAESNQLLYETVLDYTYTTANEEVTITLYNGKSTHVTIPSHIHGYPVTKLGAYVFSNSSGRLYVESITVPDTVKSIGNYAFQACTKLKSIELPETLETMGSNAFIGVTVTRYAPLGSKLAIAFSKAGYSFRVPGTDYDVEYLFQNGAVSGLELCNVDGTFTSYDIPEGITMLPYGALGGRKTLESVSFPSTLTTISSSAFSGCTGLRSVYIPENVVSIGYNAFADCSNLEHITIANPNCVIDEKVFNRCLNLKSISYKGRNLRSDSSFCGVGSCGSNLIWYAEVPGRLTISGSGAMSNYSYEHDRYGTTVNEPWFYLRNISSLVIEEGVSQIGANAFAAMTAIKSIQIPKTLTAIGTNAFLNITASVYYTPTSANRSLIDNYGGTLTWIRPSGSCGTDIIWTLEDENTLRILGAGTVSETTWSEYANDINTIVLADSVVGIGDALLAGLPQLKQIIFEGAMPEISPNAFYGIDVSAYYSHSAGWLESSKIGYGGTVIWKPYCTREGTAINQDFIGIFQARIEPSDCTVNGSEEHWRCSVCGLPFADEALTLPVNEEDLVIPAPGHDWSEAEYVWASDKTMITASRICKNDNTHVESEIAAVTRTVITEATCEEEGTALFTVTPFLNEAFTAPEPEEEIIPATGHNWNEPIYTWAEDQKTVTASHVCMNDDTHIEQETVSVRAIVITLPTKEETGEYNLETDAFENHAFEVQTIPGGHIPALQSLTVFRLPESVHAVEEEAFAGTDCEIVIIPAGCERIGTHAFQNCERLKYLLIANHDIIIAEDATEDNPNVIIVYIPDTQH